MTLTIEVAGGNFAGISAQDSDGMSYDVALQFSPKSSGESQELSAEHKTGYWCCDWEKGICRWILNAPPCPEGLAGMQMVLNTGRLKSEVKR